MKKKLGTTIWNYVCISTLLVFAASYFSASALRVKDSVANVIESLPAPTQLLDLSKSKNIERLCGLRFDKENPLSFEFIFEAPNKYRSNDQERAKLIKYFITALTVPSDKLWVNLSPYENDRVIEDELARTELGVNMLAQDYILKQLSSSLTFPESDLGREYWEMQGSHDQFNKIWISSDTADLYVGNNSIILGDTRMKVETEKDYLASKENNLKDADEIGKSSMLRLITELEKEVNHGQHFVELRQIYNSVVLANSFKTILKDHFLSNAYSNKSKLEGNDNLERALQDKIYDQYVEAFEKGVYDLIKTENINGVKKKVRYFSGGANLNKAQVYSSSIEDFDVKPDMDFFMVRVVPEHVSDYEENAKFYSELVAEARRDEQKEKEDFYKTIVVRHESEEEFDYFSWDDKEKHNADRYQGNEYSRNMVFENSKIVNPNETQLLAEYNESLQADLARCIAVVAHNQDTGKKGLAHIFPPQAEARIAERWSLEKTATEDIQVQEKINLLSEILENFKDGNWNFAVVGSIDTDNKNDANSITVSDVLNFLNEQMNIAADKIELDADEVFKTVVLDQSGNVRIYKDKSGSFRTKIENDQPDRIIKLSSSIEWGPESFDIVENVQVVKGRKKANGPQEIKFDSYDMGNVDAVHFAEYNGKRYVARMSKNVDYRTVEYKGKKRNLETDLRVFDLRQVIARIQDTVKRTGKNYLAENPKHFLRLTDGRIVILSEAHKQMQTLSEFINDTKYEVGSILNEKKTAQILKTVLEGMAWLKQAEVMSGDLHAGNILIDTKYNILLTDIGEFELLDKNRTDDRDYVVLNRDLRIFKMHVFENIKEIMYKNKESELFKALNDKINKIDIIKEGDESTIIDISINDLINDCQAVIDYHSQSSSVVEQVRSVLAKSLIVGFLTVSTLFADINKENTLPAIETVVDTVELMSSENKEIALNAYLDSLLELDSLNPTLLMLKGHLNLDGNSKSKIYFALATKIGVPMVFKGNDPFGLLPEKYSTVPTMVLADVIKLQNEYTVEELQVKLLETGVLGTFEVVYAQDQSEEIDDVKEATDDLEDASYEHEVELIKDSLATLSELRTLMEQSKFEELNKQIELIVNYSDDYKTIIEASKLGYESKIAQGDYAAAARTKTVLASTIFKMSGDYNYAISFAEEALSLYPSYQIAKRVIALYLEGNEIKKAQHLAFKCMQQRNHMEMFTSFPGFAPKAYEKYFSGDVYTEIRENKMLKARLTSEYYELIKRSYFLAGPRKAYNVTRFLNLAGRLDDRAQYIEAVDNAQKIFDEIDILQSSEVLGAYALWVDMKRGIAVDSSHASEAIAIGKLAINRILSYETLDNDASVILLNLAEKNFTYARMINSIAEAINAGVVFIETSLALSDNEMNSEVEHMLHQMYEVDRYSMYQDLLASKKISEENKENMMNYIQDNLLDKDKTNSSSVDGYGGIDFSLDGLRVEEMRAEFELPQLSSSAIKGFELSQGLSFKILNTRKVDDIKAELMFNY